MRKSQLMGEFGVKGKFPIPLNDIRTNNSPFSRGRKHFIYINVEGVTLLLFLFSFNCEEKVIFV